MRGGFGMERNYWKQIVVLALVVGLFYVGASFVLGVQGATTIAPGASSRASFTDTSTQTLDAQAGNVTQVDISGQSITTHWAGFFGNISGNITLKDSNGNTFYDWAGMGIPAGEVFASIDDSVEWSGIDCATPAELSAIDTLLGISADDEDGINQTFTSNAFPDFEVAGVSISGCNSTNAYSDGALEASTYYQILLTDTSGDAVYTTLINDSATSFQGAGADFQLLVGENDGAGTTAIYFYIELD
jgi:hypothetical protein